MLGRAIGVVLLAGCALAGAATGRAQTLDPAALLTRYEPVVEQYRSDWGPTTVDGFLTGADLERLAGTSWRLVRHSPPASALAHGGPNLRLDTRGCSPAVNLDSCYKRRPTAASVYGRVWQTPGAALLVPVTVLEYWFFYPLDDWHTPLVAPILWHMHEGDWEQVSVELSSAGVPIAIAASQHDEGVTRPWARVQLAGGTHPVVYVALGSHANYLSPGYHGVPGVPHLIPPRISGVPLPEPDYTSAQVRLGPPGTGSAPLDVVDISDGKAPWLSFAGAWGDGAFLLAGERTKKGTVFTHLRIGNSPTGPAFHAAWRDPLLQFASWPADDGH
jgi:hypothetical protein